MSFLELALEPFSEIVSYLDTHEWITLWICGDTRINWRLGKGKAVRKMTILWEEARSYPWPSLIAALDGL